MSIITKRIEGVNATSHP